MSPHTAYLSPFEPADSLSMTAHLADLMSNVSSTLKGWKPEKKEILGQQNKRSRRGSQWRDKGEKLVGSWVENDEEQEAYRIQMKKNGVMKELRSNRKMEICIWLAIGDKYSKRGGTVAQ